MTVHIREWASTWLFESNSTLFPRCWWLKPMTNCVNNYTTNTKYTTFTVSIFTPEEWKKVAFTQSTLPLVSFGVGGGTYMYSRSRFSSNKIILMTPFIQRHLVNISADGLNCLRFLDKIDCSDQWNFQSGKVVQTKSPPWAGCLVSIAWNNTLKVWMCLLLGSSKSEFPLPPNMGTALEFGHFDHLEDSLSREQYRQRLHMLLHIEEYERRRQMTRFVCICTEAGFWIANNLATTWYIYNGFLQGLNWTVPLGCHLGWISTDFTTPNIGVVGPEPLEFWRMFLYIKTFSLSSKAGSMVVKSLLVWADLFPFQVYSESHGGRKLDSHSTQTLLSVWRTIKFKYEYESELVRVQFSNFKPVTSPLFTSR